MKTPLSAPSLLLRISAIVFAAGTLTAFIWYSQVSAQRSAPVVVPEQSPVVFSGSKSFSGPVVKINPTMMTGSKSGILAPMPAPGNISLAPPPPQIPANSTTPSANVPLRPDNDTPADKVYPITLRVPTPAAEPPSDPPKTRLLMPGSKAPSRIFHKKEDEAQRSPQAQSAPPANNQKSKP